MKKDMVKKQKKFLILLILLYILTFIIYLVKPICFDVRIYIEAAQRASNLGGFPYNIFEAWEHKYILNRLIFYIIFKVASIFTSANNIILFELIVKIIYGILAILIIKCFSKSTKSFFEKYKISQSMVFGILYFSIIGSNSYFLMQTEMTAFLITLLAIIFILKNKLKYKIISAFIISTLFWLKGVTILNAIIILVVMLVDKHEKKEVIFVICWSWIFLLSEVLLINYIEPNEIKNMFLATQYLNNQTNIVYSKSHFIELGTYILLWVGSASYVINLIYHIRFKNIKLFILESFTWITLFLGVYIQKLIFTYQIGLIISAITFSIFIFFYYTKNKDTEKVNLKYKYLFMLMLYIIIISIIINIAVEINFSIEIYKNAFDAIEQLDILEEQIPDLKKEKVLYIGNGLSSYYIRADSYTGYTTTIFLSNSNEIYNNSTYIQELKNTIKSYDGKYIIIDKIEFINKFRVSDDIIKFIEENYHYKQSTNISIYEYKPENDYQYSIIYEKNT